MMSCGFTVVKCGLIDAKSSRTLSVICIYIIMPCVMINAFQIEYSRSIRNGFLLAVAAAILIHIFLLVFVQIIGKPLKLSVVEKESIIYSNSGNLVIPLVTVVLGEKWVIYASAFLSVQMILMWTHGQSLMEAKAGINWKKILCNINLIAIILGIVLFFTQIRLPVILGNTMSQISATLGPVCMIMLGMTMTEVKWKDIFSHSRIYLITILKMVVTPLLILLFLKYLPLASMVKDGKTILLISLMAVITPSATTVVQLAQLYDQDPVYASTINVMTTRVSIRTRPRRVMWYLSGACQGSVTENFVSGNMLCGYYENADGEVISPEEEKVKAALTEKIGDTFTWISTPGKDMRLMYHNFGVVRENKELIRHRMFMTKLKDGCEEEYKARHDGLVAQRGETIDPGPDSNFSIWSAGGYIFGYDEIDTTMEVEETPEAREATIAWETRQLGIMDWITNDVDWMTKEVHPSSVRLAWHN